MQDDKVLDTVGYVVNCITEKTVTETQKQRKTLKKRKKIRQ